MRHNHSSVHFKAMYWTIHSHDNSDIIHTSDFIYANKSTSTSTTLVKSISYKSTSTSLIN